MPRHESSRPGACEMAGHSQFKNIMYRKGAQDKKRAKIFTRLTRELQIAAKAGDDPASNPALRSAIQAARKENMPKDNIERAIKKGAGGGDDTNYEEMRYEGYGPGRSEEHTSELQSLMRISYAVFCLKKKRTERHSKDT